MSDYNPYRPYVIGNEWVPIQEPVVKLQRNVNNVEYGVGFRTIDEVLVDRAQFYTAQEKNTEATSYNQINIYPEGQQASSGPIKKVVIPVRSASVTGTNWESFDTINVSLCENGSPLSGPGCNLVNCLSGYGNVTFLYTGNPSNLVQRMAMSFNVNDFENELDGKRILNVSLLHRGTASAKAPDDAGLSNIDVPLQREAGNEDPLTTMQIVNAPGGSSVLQFVGPTWASVSDPLGTGSFTLANEFPNPTTTNVVPTTNALNLGDVTTLFNFSSPSTLNRLPWTFDVLSQFDDRSSNRRWIQFSSQIPQLLDGGAVSGTGRVQISFMALEVTYCEEKRVAVGGSISTPVRSHEVTTQMASTIRTMSLFSLTDFSVAGSVLLEPNKYIMTLSSVNPGQINYAPTDIEYPRLSATRPLNPLPSIPTTSILIPFPLDDTVVGRTFTEKPFPSGIMLSLLGSGQTIFPETHVYGMQVAMPVYNELTASTKLVDESGGIGDVTFPYIRFWARRFGNTAIPLTVSCFGSSASITPTEFDALDKLTTDNWREITLPLDPSLIVTPLLGGNLIKDTFSRTVVNTWGNTETGQTWVLTGTAANFDVTSGVGTIVGDANGEFATLGTFADVDVKCRVQASTLNGEVGLVARFTSATDWYSFEIDLDSGSEDLSIYRSTFPGNVAQLATTAFIVSAGTWYWIRVQCQGTNLRMKCWEDGDPEPSSWSLETTDATHASGAVGCEAFDATGVKSFDNFEAHPHGAINLPITWTATGELPGNRWEILASSAVSVSGYVQNDIPHYYSASPASYGAGISSSWGLVTPGSSGNYAATPDTSSLDVSGDIDISWEGAYQDNGIGPEQTLISKYNTTGNQRSYRLYISNSTDTLRFSWSTDGSSGTLNSRVATVPLSSIMPVGKRLSLRATLDVNNLAGGNTTTFYYSTMGLDGPWTQLGDPVIGAGATSIFISTANLTIGSFNDGTVDLFPGITHAARVSSALNIVANPTFQDQITGTTSFTDSASKVWTIHGSAYIGTYAGVDAPTTLLFDDYLTNDGTASQDAAVLLSQEVLPVSGFAISGEIQSLTNIGLNCGDVPCCIPSELYYHRLTWDLPSPEFGPYYIFQDLFDREEVDTWGLPNIYGGATSPALSVTDGKGFINTTVPIVTGTGYQLDIVDVGYNYDFKTLITNEQESNPHVRLYFRSRYALHIESLSNVMVINIRLVFPLRPSQLIVNSDIVGGPLTTGIKSAVYARSMIDGTTWKTKVWNPALSEPATWTSEIDVAALNGVAFAGLLGDYASTPDTAALDITGDIDIRAEITPNAWINNSGNQYIVSKYSPDTNNRSYALRLGASGNLSFLWSTNGTSDLEETSDLPVPFTGGRGAIRATLDVDNGSSNYTLRFYTSDTIDGPWFQLGPDESGSGTTSIFSGTAPLQVSGRDNGVFQVFNGIVHKVEVRNGINGTIVANPDFSAQPDGTTSFVDGTGKTWTMNGEAYIINDAAVATEDDISIFVAGGNILSFDNIEVTPPQYWFGNYEIQRRDEVETTWKTIMSATSSAVTGFNDYEARPGILSDYRIRRNNVYNFPSEWSDIVSDTIPAPGAGDSECLDNGHMLLFTTNEHQDGSRNLAYSSIWLDRQVDENFTFSETDFVQMQAMYDRDFYIAFRPLERGGEQFTRTILVQAAAISPETLADFTSLRDLAWDSINYVCVRDEDGNRWLANVQVPSGNVLRNRRLYLAPVNIIEVTDTPTPVDPDPWS